MALNPSSEFKGVIFQIVYVVENQSESASTLTKMTLGNTCHAKFHAPKANGSEEDFNIFLCISMVQTQDTLGKIHFGPCGNFSN